MLRRRSPFMPMAMLMTVIPSGRAARRIRARGGS
jgi:hypothetical protein